MLSPCDRGERDAADGEADARWFPSPRKRKVEGTRPTLKSLKLTALWLSFLGHGSSSFMRWLQGLNEKSKHIKDWGGITPAQGPQTGFLLEATAAVTRGRRGLFSPLE